MKTEWRTDKELQKKYCLGTINRTTVDRELPSVAQSDEHLTGDQMVAGLIPAGSDNILSWRLIKKYFGVVGWWEGAVYLTSLGRPTDIGLQLGKACYPCSG